MLLDHNTTQPYEKFKGRKPKNYDGENELPKTNT